MPTLTDMGLEAERKLVAWYCLLAQSHPRAAAVRPDHFLNPRMRALWEFCMERKTWLLSDLTALPGGVTFRLEELTQISDEAVSAAQIPHVERRLMDVWSKLYFVREMGGLLDTVRKTGIEDLAELASRAREIVAQAEAGAPTGAVSLHSAIHGVMRDWIGLVQDGEKSTRTIPLPHFELRRHYSGYARGRLHCVIGRSSHHKTTFARASCWYPAKHADMATLYWTMEDQAADIAARTVASEIPQFTTRALMLGQKPAAFEDADPDRRAHNWRQAIDQVEALSVHPGAERMWILDVPAPRFSVMLATLRALHARHRFDLIVLDYAQLIQHDRQSQERNADFWRMVSSQLAALAKELDAAILVTSQIDKMGQRASDDGKAPRASDVPFSQAWHNDSYAQIVVNKPSSDPTDREWEVIVEKWKNGPRGVKLTLQIDAAHDRIED